MGIPSLFNDTVHTIWNPQFEIVSGPDLKRKVYYYYESMKRDSLEVSLLAPSTTKSHVVWKIFPVFWNKKRQQRQLPLLSLFIPEKRPKPKSRPA
jgi:hypothetical protein